MSEAKLAVKPISELLDKKFYIPDYQRGYRWTERQVTHLLRDVADFQEDCGKYNYKKETFYCLQPVVVSLREDGQWELIDGQQRLTTLFLILKVLEPIAPLLLESMYELNYKTREDSTKFLKDIKLSRRDENIDYHHICEAYQTIVDWFEQIESTRRLKILQCILNTDREGHNVKVIWYQLPDNQVPVDVFVRLNMGKIALTNAELIRALFLKSQNFKKNEVHLRQLQIAQEWDSIEKGMSSDDLWLFLYGGKKAYPTRIEYLFELITRDMDTSGILEDDPNRTFIAYNRWFELEGHVENEEPAMRIHRVADAWRDVKKYYMTCEEWFHNRTLYHLIGYLITMQIADLYEIREIARQKGKQEFQSELKALIFNKLFRADLSEYSQIDDRSKMIGEVLDALRYKAHSQRIRSALLLFNIATLEMSEGSNSRFPFDRYRKSQWDIEHIKSVSYEAERPQKTEDQKAWLKEVLRFLTGTSDPEKQSEATCKNEELRDELIHVRSLSPFDKKLFEAVYLRTQESYGEIDNGEVDDQIKNLALLDAKTNRGYKNAIFPVKRSHILNLDKTCRFVPRCTKNVFLQYYSKNIGNMMAWTEADRDDYFEAMVETLTGFFDKKSEVK